MQWPVACAKTEMSTLSLSVSFLSEGSEGLDLVILHSNILDNLGSLAPENHRI